MLNRFLSGLKKTRQAISESVSDFKSLLARGKKLDDETLQGLEEALILADVGSGAASEIIEQLQSSGEADDPLKALAEIIARKFEFGGMPGYDVKTPHVILVVGVNGSGKTTTIAKMAQKEIAAGKKVIMAAADTFRAAAGEQLEFWANRVGAEIIKQKSGADPAAVAYDAVTAAVYRKIDCVIIDTAGRLQTKTNLMEELKKIKRVVGKALPGAPQEILMVMDATTGQNGLSQVRLFNEAVGLTGIIVTKLDGTAKGGVLVAASDRYGIPIKYVGLGEKPDDLVEFDPMAFAKGLVGINE
ncbi:MAG: signal recognition particle-docking protein FtsY [Candidatus Zixiibacteriota bacterium]|nr:MAG: signal recognition particle-docking protein FtsY [candidate division Zixibacteria bacterium]